MARRSLLLTGVVLSTSSCLLGDADFDDPVRRPPALYQERQELITLINPDGFEAESFEASLRSQDAGDDLQAVLLLDYGTPTPRGQPWQADEDQTVILSSPTGTEATRTVTLDWFASFEDPQATSECRRVTMVVSHQFAGISPYAWCPTDPSDVARVTWFVALCRTLADCSFDECTQAPEGGFEYCPDDVYAALQDGGT